MTESINQHIVILGDFIILKALTSYPAKVILHIGINYLNEKLVVLVLPQYSSATLRLLLNGLG